MVYSAMTKRLFCALLFVVVNVFAINIPNRPDSRVIDQTNTLSSQQQQVLRSALNEIYNTESHTEIQVLMVPSLDNEPIEDVSLRIARKWQIGQKNTNNGVIILIALKERKYRIEVGYGLEGVLPDGYIGNLERDIMMPYFARNDFFNGLKLVISNLGQEIARDYKHLPGRPAGQIPTKNAIIYVLLGIGIFVIIVILALASGSPGRIADILWLILNIITLASLFRGGGGGNNRDDDTGGGGDFGGGGSQGKW
ncbi:MAG: hypothetical protein K0R14_2213 [Burkholderiales bacterium]|jgi:uncharacterized protein|nr:hypothetical protein [Burkholderiales bacterium]